MLGDELLDVIHRYPDHVWVFLHEFPALTGERAEQFRERRRAYERRVEAVLQAGVDSGEFRDLEPRLTAMAWLGMHNYTYLWLKPGGRLSARDVAKPFADIFMRGITNPAGRSARVAALTAPSTRRRRRAPIRSSSARRRPPGRSRHRRGRRPCRARAGGASAMASSASGGQLVVDGRAERPRAHAVDADAVAGVLDRGDLGQLNHGRLGGAVGRRMRPRRQAGDRGGQDDRARRAAGA